ncbi:MAG: PAC2 family protein [Actinobacteria bacterium]|nr:PAC2 family protein [Actinomycetota bacterium]
MLDVKAWPELDDPVMVVALTGWVDAGIAGTGALAVLANQAGRVNRFGAIDLADLCDLQQTRPTVRLVDGVTHGAEWPAVELVSGRVGRDVVLVSGPEPSIRWRAFSAAVVEAAFRLGVRTVVALGGMPAPVSHRRPVSVLATASSRSVAQESGALRADYVGPTGAQTVLQVALGEAGIRAIGLWAQVPHYVAGTPSPTAIRALLERLRDLTGVYADLRALDEQSDAYLEKVEEGLDGRPDVADLVRRLDASAGPEDLPSGDDLAREIERFLRDER